jgi:hypothetical protein
VAEADRKAPVIKPKTAQERAEREARLASEMRANLRKRKARQRAQPERDRVSGEDSLP